ncbi:hypothetical protein [Croceibacterium ferulae]|uniref:hypothetical protein n=1 Tax=Croceibacterium ferulae TaxID=1854641 RepID=UPI003BABF6D4
MAAGGAPVRLRNLAAGVESSDAATVGQLHEGLEQILSGAGAYTDRQIRRSWLRPVKNLAKSCIWYL